MSIYPLYLGHRTYICIKPSRLRRSNHRIISANPSHYACGPEEARSFSLAYGWWLRLIVQLFFLMGLGWRKSCLFLLYPKEWTILNRANGEIQPLLLLYLTLFLQILLQLHGFVESHWRTSISVWMFSMDFSRIHWWFRSLVGLFVLPVTSPLVMQTFTLYPTLWRICDNNIWLRL